jgi:outer membrane immunogenic protein
MTQSNSNFSIKALRPWLFASCIALLAVMSAPRAGAEGFPQLPQPFDWNGFYIGGNAGANYANYDFGGYHTKLDVTQQFFDFEGPLLRPTDGPAIQEPVGGDAFLFFPASGNGNNGNGGTDLSLTGGGQIGFNKQFGHFVFGVEGAFNGVANNSNWVKSKGSDTAPFFFDGISADTTLTTMRQAQSHWNGAAMGKFGYATGPLLFYVIGGASFTDVSTTAEDRANTDFFVRGGDAPTPQGQIGGFIGSIASHNRTTDESVLVGYTVGTGFECAVTKICSMGVEYRHNGAEDRNYHFASDQGPVFPGNTNVGTDSDQVTFKVNFYLGHLGN